MPTSLAPARAAIRFLAVAALVIGLLPATAAAQVIDTFVTDIDPTAIATGADGVLYVATRGRIYRIDADGTPVPVVGDGTRGFSGDGGPALAARISRVPGLAIAPNGDLYFIEGSVNRIRRVSDGIITTVAGNGSTVHSGDGGPALEAGLENPTSLAVDDSGNVHFTTGHRVRTLFPYVGWIQTLVNTEGVAGNNDVYHHAGNVQVDSPDGITFHDGKLWFADNGNNRILSVEPSGYYMSSVFGEGWGIPGDFTGTSMAADDGVGVYVAQPHLHRVLRYPQNLADNPYAGDGVAGFAGDGGHVHASRLDKPLSIAMAGDTLYIADAGNRRIRRVRPPSTDLPVPPAPTATTWYYSANVTVVPWTHPAGYSKVEYQVVSEPATNVSLRFPATETLTRNFPQLSPGTSYSFKVRAIYDDVVQGPWSPASAPVVVSAAQNPRISDMSIVEGDTGPRQMVFKVTIDTPALQDILFDITTEAAGVAGPADFDMTSLMGARIRAGETSMSFPVTIHGDVLPEEDEVFLVFMSRDGFAAGSARGTIVDDDGVESVFSGTEDRFTALENGEPPVLDVLDNDFLAAGALVGGSLSIAEPPLHGIVIRDDRGTTGNAADDLFTYHPAADWAGEDAFVYRACNAFGDCYEAMATIRVLMFEARHLQGAQSGRDSATTARLRAMDRVRYLASPLRSIQRFDLVMSADPRPDSPWDDGRAGTALRMFAVPASAQAQRWRAFVQAGVPAGRRTDLYVGVDDDHDGAADAGEVRCVVTMRTGGEFCEATIRTTAGAGATWWVLAHNPGSGSHAVDLHAGASPLVDGDGTLVATGPATLQAGEAFGLTTSWDDPSLLPGERRIGFVRVLSGAAELDLLPVVIARSTPATGNAAAALRAGLPYTLKLAPGAAHDRLFVDVPAGASSLAVAVQSDAPVSVFLARADAGAGLQIAAAPARAAAQASTTAVDGQATLTVSGGQLAAGRWYVTPVNDAGTAATMSVTATVTGAAPTVRPGSYFDAARSGHGVFLYPAGGDWAGLWYTYLADGTPTWYWLQGPKPGPDGIWTGTLYDSAWLGSGNHLVAAGHVSVTPTGADAFQFTHEVHGATGSEPMAALGRGCPSAGGLPVDVSSHWFDPASAGTGYSVQLWPDYEYYAAFVYDAQGVARFLTAERSGFGGSDATLVLEQLAGFCPTCERSGDPARTAIGTLRRVIGGGELTRIEVAGTYTGTVPGVWSGDDAVQVLGGAGTTQGCAP